ncbi:MAG: DUF3365 domain-containing protein [Epsilonproteobacteria bacterium]|nr:DUF3365 domain-containing protein [Campylobacterota bacterium]
MKTGNLVLIASLSATMLHATDAEIKQEGVKYIKMLGGELKSNLKVKMKADATGSKAMDFCSGAATQLTEDVNSKLPAHAKVRRTALKYRNPANKPDATDIEVMKAYVEKITTKQFSPKDIVVVAEGNTSRVYKPLLTGAVCLKCHGSDISTGLKATLDKVYPKDLATGFKEGDFRGVVVAEIKK